ncbi:hypothetical protein EGR_03995 [Echinococcus granulosus]|uniref:Uncharacterized protein n=1 Tax=Echinococcus granulosus TaxID=6210 RepID=W6US15_ECHGR|nr:hypothetical protein EGR_03995 [Echinococcus granulosus]EUB61147.1 hypothetical protein EGR_03995 [Echinococcus granulosus]
MFGNDGGNDNKIQGGRVTQKYDGESKKLLGPFEQVKNKTQKEMDYDLIPKFLDVLYDPIRVHSLAVNMNQQLMIGSVLPQGYLDLKLLNGCAEMTQEKKLKVAHMNKHNHSERKSNNGKKFNFYYEKSPKLECPPALLLIKHLSDISNRRGGEGDNIKSTDTTVKTQMMISALTGKTQMFVSVLVRKPQKKNTSGSSDNKIQAVIPPISNKFIGMKIDKTYFKATIMKEFDGKKLVEEKSNGLKDKLSKQVTQKKTITMWNDTRPKQIKKSTIEVLEVLMELAELREEMLLFNVPSDDIFNWPLSSKKGILRNSATFLHRTKNTFYCFDSKKILTKINIKTPTLLVGTNSPHDSERNVHFRPNVSRQLGFSRFDEAEGISPNGITTYQRKCCRTFNHSRLSLALSKQNSNISSTEVKKVDKLQLNFQLIVTLEMIFSQFIFNLLHVRSQVWYRVRTIVYEALN